MFSRWLFVRCKAAENALNEGRIDEAFERLAEPDVRKHRRAQKLTGELSAALLARARLHNQAGRYRDALEDLGRIESLTELSDEAVALRARAEEELQHRVGRHAENDRAYQRAADDLRAGRLESGRLALENLEDPARREQLKEELDIRVERSDQLIKQAAAALDRGDVLAACRYWQEARTRHGRTSESDELASRLAPAYRERIEAWLREGRLDTLRPALEFARALEDVDPTMADTERLAGQIRKAAAEFNAGDYSALRDSLLRLRARLTKAAWLNDALAALEKISAAQALLLSSPLGLLGTTTYNAPVDDRTVLRTPAGTDDSPARREAGAALGGDPLLMLVDGTGSAILVASDVVRIGRAGAMNGIEIPIPADIHSHHADILRDGDDYFLVAHAPVQVNRRSVSRTLLRHGDRITLGGNGKLVFHKPSAKSATAVLQISDRCRLPQDVSLAVLFRDTCLLGPQPSCHIRTREGDSRLVLFERGGQLFARRAGRDGRPTGPADPLPRDRTSDVGDVRITIKRYNPGSGGQSA